MSEQKQNNTSLSEPFKFIQMNFWEGRLTYPILNFLNREKPDIFSSQEMISGEKDPFPSYFSAEGMINKGLFDRYILGGSMPWMTFRGTVLDIYCAAFVKDPIICEFENKIQFSNQEGAPVVTSEEKTRYYGMLHTIMRLKDGSKVHILNHHGNLVIGKRMGSDISDWNFKKIAEYIKTLSGPIILSGDFNLVKEATSFAPLKALGLKNLNDVHGVTVARNEFSWNADEAVSHIFINDDVIVDEYHIAQDNVSDHLPLVMSCRVKK